MINAFEYADYIMITGLNWRYKFLRKHIINDSLHVDLYMNDITREFLCSMLGQKLIILCKLLKEKDIINELCILNSATNDEVGTIKRYSLLFKDNKFISNCFGKIRNSPTEILLDY